jgi:hypothetical protein
VPGPPTLSQQHLHVIHGSIEAMLFGFGVGLLTLELEVMMFGGVGCCFRKIIEIDEYLDLCNKFPELVGIVVLWCFLMLNLFPVLELLSGIPHYDAYIFKFFFVWLASQLYFKLFTLVCSKANNYSFWTPLDDEFLQLFWATLWGFAATVLQLLTTMYCFDYCLMALVLAYVFITAIMLRDWYRAEKFTLTLVIRHGILNLATAAALYAMMPSPLTAP